MNKLIAICLVMIVVTSCTTTGRIAKSKDFSITQETKVAVQSPSDMNFGSMLENELLFLGLNVVPVEVAATGLKTDSNANVTSSGNSASGNAQTLQYVATYIPAGIVISAQLQISRYPMATYFLGGNIRVIDLVDNRLLASYMYKGGNFTLYNPEKIIRSFINDLQMNIN